MRVVFACAGTGGHINPAIAIAKNIIKQDSKSKILFIGTEKGMENDLVKNASFKIKHVHADKILREFTLKNIKALYSNVKGISDAKKILKDFKADLVIGTGGYICIPVMLAAKSLKIKYLLHESNAYPGVSVKLLAKNSDGVMLGFKEAEKRITPKCNNKIYTGTPIKFFKEEYEKLDKKECRKELGIPITKKVVLVSGGSLGALSFGETVINIFKKYKDDERLKDSHYILITGEKNYQTVIDKIKEAKIESKNLEVKKFVYDMDKMYKSADIAVTRSGALTINELIMTKTPSVLIPYPYAAENHQFFNANVLASKDAAEIILQKELTEDVLYSKINNILFDTNRIKNIKNTLEEIYVDDVDDRIYKVIKNTIEK